MAVFPLILLTILVNFQSISCLCGPPGSAVGADVYGHTSNAQEGESIIYQCKLNYKQVYGSVRKCQRGKWTPRIPKCAEKESTRLMVDNYKVNYYDLRDSIGLDGNSSFEYLAYITLNTSRRFIFQIKYSPKARLSYVEMDLQIPSEQLPTTLKVSLHINDYRNCVQSSQTRSEINSVIELKFICEAKTDVDYDIEGKDLPNSLRFSFESQTQFMSRVLRISVFRFINGCGSPDIPLNARTIMDSSKNTMSIYSSKPNRYKIPGVDLETIYCLYEGNWNKEFQSLYSIVTCPLDEFNFGSSLFKNISKEYFEYFNDTLLASVDSKIQFQCNNSQNSSEFHYVYCRVDGHWTGEFDVCNEVANNETISGNPNQLFDDSDKFVIFVTLLSTFFSTLTLTLIFGAFIVWRRKVSKKRKTKLRNSGVKYVKKSEFENYIHILGDELSVTSGQYEAVDYQAIDNNNIPETNHLYMQIY